MFQAERVILECTVKIGHGWVARIARFSEQAQIREHQLTGQPGAVAQLGVCRCLPAVAIQEHQNKYDATTDREDEV
jgi:hypothetical protein